MKAGYKRLLIFVICLAVILLINSFYLNILSGYKISAFILVLFAFFHFVFVFEKDRHRYLGEILFEVFLFVMTYFILYYLLGIVVGLARTVNYFTVYGIFRIILPMVLYIILREVFRYNMLCKADNSRICSILVVALLVLFDLTSSPYTGEFRSKYDVLRYLSLYLLPVISKNISFSFISKKTGYIPIIAYDLVMTLYPFILPIIPNPNDYLVSIIIFTVPILFALRINRFFNLRKVDLIPSDYHKKKYRGMLVPLTIVLVLVYLYSGYFRLYAIAIGGASMEPEIHKGDVVIIDQKYNDYKVGDIIAFRQGNVIIVHRIIKKIEVNKSYYYFTQGDANASLDDIVLSDEMIVGKVGFRIPFVGFPTVWLGEL